MKNKLLIQRSKSQYSKKYLTLNTKQSTPYLNYEQKNSQNSNKQNQNLDDFFDNFHQNFIVIEDEKKKQIPKNKKQKPSLSQFIANKSRKNKQNNNNTVKTIINDQKQSEKTKSFSQKINNQDKKVKKQSNTNKSVLMQDKKKHYLSDKNLLLALKQTAYAFLYKSSKNSVKKKSTQSTNKSVNKSTKRVNKNNEKDSKKKLATKQKFMRTGSTSASNGLGNSTLVNFKEDIHIANYLRLKINA